MKHLILALALFLGCNCAFAQSKTDEEAVKATINLLFDGMRNADTAMINQAFAQQNTMETIVKSKDGKVLVSSANLADFKKSIAAPHPEKYDERIVFTKILIDDQLASVWTDYKFYIGEKFSHCGVNSFQLVKFNQTWKIVYIIDTRRKENCN